jgi:SAM-dependent methyltransferase
MNTELTLKVRLIHSLLNRSRLFNILLVSPDFRDMLVKIRYRDLIRNSSLQIGANSKGITSNAIEHNFDPKRMFFPDLSKRPDLISKPLSCEISVIQNSSKLKILLIGARTEAEIFSFRLCGFAPSNIHAIDLASYTPLIKIMNAEKLEFPDDYFDIIIMGWVLEFVQHIDQVKSEVLRCLKPEGILGIGAMYHPETQDMLEYSEIKNHTDRIWSPKCTLDIRKYFGIGEVIFNSDVKVNDRDKRNDLVLIGRVNK